jgi:glycosyltransferase involved in cell wall biosynthesis
VVAHYGQGVRRLLAPPPQGPARPTTPPTFSVVIAAYQVAQVIGDALESAFAQTYPPIEIVVCDDGSTDDLDAAVAPYRDRIVLLHKSHGGEASAKNAAAAAARGDFVVILDADDVFLPTRLEALAELASARPDLDILTTDAFLEVDGRVVRRCYEGGWTFETRDQRREILRRNFIFGLAAVRRERLLALGGFDESIRWTADWDCWLRLILAGSRAGCVAEPLARYRLREASLSARREHLVRGKISTLEKARRNPHLQDNDRPVLEAALAGYHWELTFWQFRRAIREGGSDARHLALRLVRHPGVRLTWRAQAGAALLAPAAVGHLVRRQDERFWTGAGNVRVRRRRAQGRGTLKVAFYTDAVELGGAERSLAHLVATLSPRIEACVLGVEPRIVRAVAEGRRDARRVVLPFIRSRYDVGSIAAHFRALAEIRPDVFHANLSSPWSCQMAIFIAALMPRVRVVAVEQLPVPAVSPHQRWAKRVAARALAAHVAVGERSARETERLAGLPQGSVRAIHNGVPDVPLPPRERRPSQPTVGFIGRMEPQKGVDILLRALAELPRARAVLIGEGRERSRLERMADRLGVSARVVWLGWQEEARRHLSSFDVLALPSRYEGFPLVVLEALLAQVPVVAADVGSVGEAVLPMQTGVLVPPDDPESLAAALDDILRDEERREAMGRRGRALVLERFTAEAMARRFEALYEEILA